MRKLANVLIELARFFWGIVASLAGLVVIMLLLVLWFSSIEPNSYTAAIVSAFVLLCVALSIALVFAVRRK